ncbi:MAG: nitrilase-related carbon-nitrogen hydrolase [Bacillota bacterium]
MNCYVAAAVQYEPEFGAVDVNLEQLAGLVQQAASAGAQLVVLPEMATTGYVFRSREEISPLVQPVPGPVTDFLGQLAARTGTHLVMGLAEVDEETGIFYNTAVLMGSNGALLGKYRKLHSFVDETRWAKDGDLGMPVFDTALGRIAMMICMDADYFETARLAALQGADVIAFPTNWLGPAPSKSWRARALENRVYVVAADRWGEERGIRFSGGSAIIGPGGEVLSWLERGNGVVTAEIDLATARDKHVPGFGHVLARRMPREYHGVVINSYLWSPASVQGLPPERQSGVAVVQLRARPGSPEAMVISAVEAVEAVVAGTGGAVDLVVLPEALVAAGADHAALAEEIPGPVTHRFLELATRFGLYIAFGLPERAPSGLYSSVVLVGPDEIYGLYRKLHLTPADEQWCRTGDLGMPTVDLPLGRVALLTATDLMVPETARTVAKKGADLICAPGAWADPSTTWLWDDRWAGNDTLLAVANLSGQGFAGRSTVFGNLEEKQRARVDADAGWACLTVDTKWERRIRQKEMLRRLQPGWYSPLVKGKHRG